MSAGLSSAKSTWKAISARNWAAGSSPTSRHALGAAGEQRLADPQQHLGQHRVLAGEVPVDRRAGDADRGTDVVDPDGPGAALGEELGGGPEDLVPAGGALRVGVQRCVVVGEARRARVPGEAMRRC